MLEAVPFLPPYIGAQEYGIFLTFLNSDLIFSATGTNDGSGSGNNSAGAASDSAASDGGGGAGPGPADDTAMPDLL